MNNILETYEKVIYGDLRPWTPQNKDQKKFNELLNPTFDFEPDVEDPFKTIEKALKKSPMYSSYEHIGVDINPKSTPPTVKVVNLDDSIFDGLFDISIEPYFDDKTKYYYHLLENENNKILRALNQDQLKDYINFPTFVNAIFSQIKLYTADSHKLYKSIDYPKTVSPYFLDDVIQTEDELYQKKVNKYILEVIQTRLSQLLLSVKDIYTAFILDDFKTEDDIYAKLYRERPPIINVINKSPKLLYFRLDTFLKKENQTTEEAITILSEIEGDLMSGHQYRGNNQEEQKRKNELYHYYKITENLIFINHFNLTDKKINLEFLKSDEDINTCYESFLSLTKTKLEEFVLVKDRITFISNQIVDIRKLNNDSDLKNSDLETSLIRKAITWLTTEKEFYQANLKLDLKELSFAGIEKIKTNLTVAEIALLFRTLHDNKLIEVKNKTDLFQTISKVFSSKKQDDISANTIKNHFDTPDYKAMDFWDTGFPNLRSINTKLKEK